MNEEKNEDASIRMYHEVIRQASIVVHGCEVCHRHCTQGFLLEVQNIAYTSSGKRAFPWRICKECAEKISSAFEKYKKGER